MQYLDQKKRAQQKIASRKADQAWLASGEVSGPQLSRNNGFIPSAMLDGARIVRKGCRSIIQSQARAS